MSNETTTGSPALAERIDKVRARIRMAEVGAERPENSVTLVAVSKTKPTSAIEQAYATGQRAFGENYVQEAVDKINALQHFTDIEWHFIGPLQSNKTRLVAEYFHWMHTVDRLKIAQRLSTQRPAALPPLQVLVQVNIDDEDSKSGVAAHEALKLASQILTLPNLQLRGLMAIPKANVSAHEQSETLAALRTLFVELQQLDPNIDTLSVGMSNDLEAAVAHGSTLVRIGTDIFGPRETAA
ncbi:YggS family pyridoxal phosphate-dependent enzyme [Aliidiomarina celeris]|uniref:YggS family pyridoxal phosphate-dependent enzyme n=1 Tax=Aliidiomarina celeris TaxID=2249428 RepID=UPI000DEBF857|nr:YggS family pyridoxal phosphate-dependent enzyme [Aliidiomarina celeris]